jgi:hypothetical protein
MSAMATSLALEDAQSTQGAEGATSSLSHSRDQASQIGPVWACGQCRGPTELYRAVLSCTAAQVTRLSMGPRGRGTTGTTGRSVRPMPVVTLSRD